MKYTTNRPVNIYEINVYDIWNNGNKKYISVL